MRSFGQVEIMWGAHVHCMIPAAMRQHLPVLGAAFAVLVVACSASQAPATNHQDDTADPRSEDLRILPGDFSRLLVDNIVADDAHHPEGFGVPDARIPYPDTYWPFLVTNGSTVVASDGIDFRWQGASTPSALEKFATVVSAGDAAQIAKTKQWEHDHHGPGLGVKQNRQVLDWEGHCPGWTGASLANAPILHPVFVKPDAAQVFVPCSEADARTGQGGCTRFDIGDINALEAEVYVDGVQPLVGAGCFTRTPSTDEYDRIKRNPDGFSSNNGSGCKGLNPGALMMILGNRMKRDQLPFAINAQQPGITDQIWNQPAYRYFVNRYEELPASRAIALVAGSATPPASYVWNPQAKGFALVDISIAWVKEHAPTTQVISGKVTTRKHRVQAILELDQDIVGDASTRARAQIIGGEYLTDDAAAAQNDSRTFGPNRLTVPTFVWVSVDAGPEDLTVDQAEDTRFEHHNPFIKPSLVKRLVELGTK
jgi:hypothetical protein